VLTKKGHNRFVSHQTESINYNSEMSDWVAENEKEYLSKAVNFASNINELVKIRKNLRKKTNRLPAFNNFTFAEEFDKLLWKTWHEFIKYNK